MNDKSEINQMAQKYKDEMMRLYSKSSSVKNDKATENKTSPPKPEIKSEPKSGQEVKRSKFLPPEEILAAENSAASAVSDEPFQGNYGFDTPDTNNADSELEPLYTPDSDDSTDPILSGKGYLKIEASTGNGAVPISGATVIVTRKIGSKTYLYRMLMTDSDGATETVELPAPDISYSETSDPAEKPFADYTVGVSAKGFYDVRDVTVPVFSTVKSIQPISLIPLAEFDEQGSISPDENNHSERR